MLTNYMKCLIVCSLFIFLHQKQTPKNVFDGGENKDQYIYYLMLYVSVFVDYD